jgi:hypothetical protein
MPSPPSEYTVRHGPVMFESMAKTRLTFAKEAGLRGDGEVHGSAKPNGVGALTNCVTGPLVPSTL